MTRADATRGAVYQLIVSYLIGIGVVAILIGGILMPPIIPFLFGYAVYQGAPALIVIVLTFIRFEGAVRRYPGVLCSALPIMAVGLVALFAWAEIPGGSVFRVRRWEDLASGETLFMLGAVFVAAGCAALVFRIWALDPRHPDAFRIA